MRVFVLVCDHMPLTTCNYLDVCACLHMHICECVGMCTVNMHAVYSEDIISRTTQRWVVTISLPSMPFEQHGNHLLMYVLFHAFIQTLYFLYTRLFPLSMHLIH